MLGHQPLELFTGVLATAIGMIKQRVSFQCKYFPTRTSAPKCFLKQYLMAELKPPAHVVPTLSS